MPGRPTVALLFGGRSSEHGVSCITAGGVLGAIDRDAWNVLAIGITPQGRWTLQDPSPDVWKLRDGVMPRVADAGPTVLPPQQVGDKVWRLEQDGVIQPLGEVDVAFPLLHGPWGEDGTLQGALELIDVRYVGSGVLASAIGMDKQFMKGAFRAAGLPVTPDVVVLPGQDISALRPQIEALGLPVFVKPTRAGSSMGISRVGSWDQLEQAITDARAHDPKVLIEAAVVGREIETAVLGARDGVRTSPAGEIITGGEHSFYDFEAKYLDESHVQLVSPAQLEPQVAVQVSEIAARAFAAVSAEGIARVDVFVGPDGTITVNEINTMPGFTPTSMYPRMWAAGGMAYADLIEELLQAALARPVGLR